MYKFMMFWCVCNYQIRIISMSSSLAAALKNTLVLLATLLYSRALEDILPTQLHFDTCWLTFASCPSPILHKPCSPTFSSQLAWFQSNSISPMSKFAQYLSSCGWFVLLINTSDSSILLSQLKWVCLFVTRLLFTA